MQWNPGAQRLKEGSYCPRALWGGGGWLLCCKVVSGAPRTEAPPKASISQHGHQSQRRRQLSRATSLSFVEEALCEMSLATDDMFASL